MEVSAINSLKGISSPTGQSSGTTSTQTSTPTPTQASLSKPQQGFNNTSEFLNYSANRTSSCSQSSNMDFQKLMEMLMMIKLMEMLEQSMSKTA
tara:strand:- start:999 stop:1280 length:282 start_codon:yes stop_codon:yes gene_type:complete